jgi:hypothetical protein
MRKRCLIRYLRYCKDLIPIAKSRFVPVLCRGISVIDWKWMEDRLE